MTARTLLGRTRARSVSILKMTASRFRANLDRVLDEVIEKGTVVLIRRRWRAIRIAADEPARKLDRLVARPECVVGDPDALVHVNAWIFGLPTRHSTRSSPRRPV